MGSMYPAEMTDEGGDARLTGEIVFLDPTNQPAPPAPPITSGALPAFGAWVSGTAKQNPNTYQTTVYVEVVTDGTANAATCAVAISPDDTTFTTLATPGASAAVNTVGAVTSMATVVLPFGWWIKLTFSHCTVAASHYA